MDSRQSPDETHCIATRRKAPRPLWASRTVSSTLHPTALNPSPARSTHPRPGALDVSGRGAAVAWSQIGSSPDPYPLPSTQEHPEIALAPRRRALREEFSHDSSRTLVRYGRSPILRFPHMFEEIDWKGNMVTRKVVDEVNGPDPFTICHQ